jgi:hypothetical protein
MEAGQHQALAEAQALLGASDSASLLQKVVYLKRKERQLDDMLQ